MPELPEVETTRRGIEPHVVGRRISGSVVRDARLRWPVPVAAIQGARNALIHAVDRRAKYLLLRTDHGSLMVHLGMSGSLRILPAATPPEAHDHFDLLLDDGFCLRLRDPRRFGSLHWLNHDRHPLLERLGPEPFDDGFDGDYLYARSRGRRRSVKAFIMDGRIVVGVGNIYASEALFAAGIHPARSAGRVARARYERLADEIRRILAAAIDHGGTTLRDFTNASGAPGYFRVELAVYGRKDGICPRCGGGLRTLRQEQRATWYCPACQR